MNNPPAFPQDHDVADCYSYLRGMTLRDYFAIHAPGDELVAINDPDDLCNITGREQPDNTIEMISYNAEVEAYLRYVFADAMLKEREK